jgi:hypothetical protein
MLQAALSAVIDLASAILALEGGSTGGSNTTTTNNNNNAACSEIANSWKRVQSYRNRVMGLYYPVLAYIYEEPPVPSVNPVNNINSNNANTNSQLNAFGNNKLSGDVGNLSGITVRSLLPIDLFFFERNMLPLPNIFISTAISNFGASSVGHSHDRWRRR